MREVVIVDAVRSPIGKRNGVLKDWHPVDLSAQILKALVRRNNLDPEVIGDVVWGCVTTAGEQAANPGRFAVLAAGWPESVPGTTVDRACGSSQQAVSFAVGAVACGHYDVAIGGGVESMTRVPMGSSRVNGPGKAYGPLVAQRYGQEGFNQGVSAEEVAVRWNLDRQLLNELAVQSHERAAAATDAGLFADEIEPIEVADEDGTTAPVAMDQGIRRGVTTESLAALKTPFKQDGLITAGNSSQISDGSAAVLVMTADKAKEFGLTPMARVVASSLAGVDPLIMLTAPIPATQKALKQAGLSVGDIGAFEVNEAFACVPAAWMADMGADAAKVNPLGGAIALGHPLGGSGARLMTTLLHHMRRNGIRYGLQTMCEAGGMANATVLELIDA